MDKKSLYFNHDKYTFFYKMCDIETLPLATFHFLPVLFVLTRLDIVPEIIIGYI